MLTTDMQGFEGDTLQFEVELRTDKVLTEQQWTDAVPELILQAAAKPHDEADAVGGSLTIQAGVGFPKVAKLAAGTMPPVGRYRFRVRVTFSDDTVLTFPNGYKWNTLTVVENGEPETP